MQHAIWEIPTPSSITFRLSRPKNRKCHSQLSCKFPIGSGWSTPATVWLKASDRKYCCHSRFQASRQPSERGGTKVYSCHSVGFCRLNFSRSRGAVPFSNEQAGICRIPYCESCERRYSSTSSTSVIVPVRLVRTLHRARSQMQPFGSC